ncbi:MAG: hypothetical protein WDW38_001153 [Sanguina aurantia]
MLQLYAVSNAAKDIRLTVQRLNAARLELEDDREEEDQDGALIDTHCSGQPPGRSAAARPAPDWANYLESEEAAQIAHDPEVWTGYNGADTFGASAPAPDASRHGSAHGDRYTTTVADRGSNMGKGSRKRSVCTPASLPDAKHREKPSREHTLVMQQARQQQQDQQRQRTPGHHQPVVHQLSTDPQSGRQSGSTTVHPQQPPSQGPGRSAGFQDANLAGSTARTPWTGSRDAQTDSPQAGPSVTTQLQQDSRALQQQQQQQQHHPHSQPSSQSHHHTSSSPFQQQQQQQQQPHMAQQHQHQHGLPAHQHHSKSQQQPHEHRSAPHTAPQHADGDSRSHYTTAAAGYTDQQQPHHHLLQPAPAQGGWGLTEAASTEGLGTFNRPHHQGRQATPVLGAQHHPAPASACSKKPASGGVWDSFAADEEAEGGADDRDAGPAGDQSCMGGYAGGRLMTVL